jgi:hypothetical protein
VMARVLKRGSNSIDVGAHRGTMLRQMVAVNYAVEPHM